MPKQVAWKYFIERNKTNELEGTESMPKPVTWKYFIERNRINELKWMEKRGISTYQQLVEAINTDDVAPPLEKEVASILSMLKSLTHKGFSHVAKAEDVEKAIETPKPKIPATPKPEPDLIELLPNAKTNVVVDTREADAESPTSQKAKSKPKKNIPKGYKTAPRKIKKS